MATLVSPGVSISVSDESFYAPAGAGTVPLIVIATSQDKTGPDGTSTAAYTTKATANKLYNITSQRELLQNFGNPSFKTSGGTPVHGDETNEYGLAAAYSFLGLANRAYVLRADVDLGQLEASATAPAAKPAANSIWVDTGSSAFGIKEYDGSKWVSQAVLITTKDEVYANAVPKTSFSTNGKFAAVALKDDGTQNDFIPVFEKIAGNWYSVGSSAWSSAKSSADFQWGTHTTIPTTKQSGGGLTSGDVFMQSTAPNSGANISVKQYDASTGQFVSQDAPIFNTSKEAYAYHKTAGSLTAGAFWFDAFDDSFGRFATVRLNKWNGESSLTVSSTAAISDTAIADTKADAANAAFQIQVNSSATLIDIFATSSTSGFITADDMVTDIQTALSAASAASDATQITVSNQAGVITFVNTLGNDIKLIAGAEATTVSLGDLNLTAATTSNFKRSLAAHTASASQPVGVTANATLWYDADISTNNVDLLEHNGTTWVTLTTDFQTKATEPTVQSDGTTSLANGDVWLNSSDTEDLKVYKHNGTTWVLVDLTDQSTPDGILFDDFRQSASASLDADAPSAALYPQGMLGWNYRASGGNVKEWRVNYALSSSSTANVWVSMSGNAADGSGLLLRKAQRKAVTKQLQAAIVSNDDIRNETNRFNLVAVPGYPELIDEMLALSVDRKDTVFSIVDAPLRLKADNTSTAAWATNANTAVENGENGLVSSSAQAGVYYPHALTTNTDGTNILVPASHMALRTFAYNDQVAFPWFAPAGFQRGLVSNATSVGYLDSKEGEYVPVSLNEGQRDGLYLNKVNPIASFPGRGISVFGQKTLNPSASALDRVNVSRLVIYLREQLDDAVKPFLFEPNDSVTRNNARAVVDRLLSGLVTQRGLFDYVTVCDDSNNTPARIDRNELHIDIAIQPVKAVEFIYIPIRIQNTLGSTG
jgi:hypothetical protein